MTTTRTQFELALPGISRVFDAEQFAAMALFFLREQDRRTWFAAESPKTHDYQGKEDDVAHE